MTNEQAKAYMKLTLSAMLRNGVIKQSSDLNLFEALDWTLDEYFDMYTEEEAVRKAERL